MAEHERARTNSCPACDDAHRSAITKGGLLQCECGTWHGAPDARWPRESRETLEPTTGVRMRPGLDAPIGSVPEPRRDTAPPDLAAVRDSAEEAAVRVLITELRPHGPGPDQDPASVPAQGPGASLAPRAGGGRAPWDVAAPRGAFVRLPPALDAEVCARIGRVPDATDRAALEYLRTSGHLANGFALLAVAVAVAVAPAEKVAKWAGDHKHGNDRARVWGAGRLARACVAWESAREEG